MKKTLPMILVIIMLLAACSRGGGGAGSEKLMFYYLGSGDGASQVIDSERRELGDAGTIDFLNTYLKGPISEELTSPFPVNTHVTAVQKTDAGLNVTMSEEYSQLGGYQKTLAESCLTMTALAATQAPSLTITDFDGQSVQRTSDMYLFEVDQDNLSDDDITLYFADENGGYLVAETRSLVTGQNESTERYVLDQLLRGPMEDGLNPVIPDGTALRSVMVQGGICSVDFSSEFLENKPKTEQSELVTIFAIVDSLTALDEVSSVMITVEGNTIDVYRYMSLSSPLTGYDGIIGPVRSSMNEMAIMLYTESWSPDYLAALPTIVRRKVNITTEEQILSMLLSFEPPSGYENPVPAGTAINSVSVSDGVCTVDLGSQFVSNSSNTAAGQRLAVLSIAATLTQLEYIDSVRFLVDGEVTSLSEYDLTDPVTVSGDVFFP